MMAENEITAIRAAMPGTANGMGCHRQWAGLAQKDGGKEQKEVQVASQCMPVTHWGGER